MGPDIRAMGFCVGFHEGVLSLRMGRIGCIPQLRGLHWAGAIASDFPACGWLAEMGGGVAF